MKLSKEQVMVAKGIGSSEAHRYGSWPVSLE